MQGLLRNSWDLKRYLKGTDESEKRRPLLLEESGRAIAERVSSILRSDHDWALIALVRDVTFECEAVGRWCEGCPCCSSQTATHAVPDPEQASVADTASGAGRRQRKRRAPARPPCPLKGCKAPELAQGLWADLQCNIMRRNHGCFAGHVACVSDQVKSELWSVWHSSRAKLLGRLVELGGHMLC